jgi:hypothetical protein
LFVNIAQKCEMFFSIFSPCRVFPPHVSTATITRNFFPFRLAHVIACNIEGMQICNGSAFVLVNDSVTDAVGNTAPAVGSVALNGAG